jgi:zinc transport system ATP-binding protein
MSQTNLTEVIAVRHLWAGYEGETILEDVNLSVQELDFLAIIGPNGGGKTTLIKVLLGLIKPLEGTVSILGRDVTKGRRYIGYVPQAIECDRAFPITVWEVVKMGRLGRVGLLRNYGKKDHEKVEQALAMVNMLDLKNKKIGELSGGQKQRVYIARALATEPKILILDEPTASIDPQIKSSIYSLLKSLNEFITIILISHDVGVISSYVKSVGCLNRRFFYHQDTSINLNLLESIYQAPTDFLNHD